MRLRGEGREGGSRRREVVVRGRRRRGRRWMGGIIGVLEGCFNGIS